MSGCLHSMSHFFNIFIPYFVRHSVNNHAMVYHTQQHIYITCNTDCTFEILEMNKKLFKDKEIYVYMLMNIAVGRPICK